jgi:LmbE family N-acetylglucosaminyl deacetylase
MSKTAFAVVAHPDDIEFGMAGTLVLLGRAGCELHYMNIANGSCGSVELDADTIAVRRTAEAECAACLIGAVFHPPLVPDIEIFYEKGLLARLGSIMRDVAPDILLVPSPRDYMEDHMNACRLAVSAAFCRTMPNFPVDPPRGPVMKDVTVYHAQPYGNRDDLGRLVEPDLFVDTAEVMEIKARMLEEHRSQKEWLDRSQGVGAYVQEMKRQGAELGNMSGRFAYAEGWRRHNHRGLCAPHADPLGKMLAGHVVHDEH